MGFVDSLTSGIGTILKVMLENVGALAGCVQLQDAKTAGSEDEYIDAEKICANLESRLSVSSADSDMVSSIVAYCRKSCEPEMRPVPLMATPITQPTAPSTEVASTHSEATTPPADMAPASLLPMTPSAPPSSTVPMEMSAGLGMAIPAWHVDPYSLEYRGDPYGGTDEDDPVEPATPSTASTPANSSAPVAPLAPVTFDPYAEIPDGGTNTLDTYAPNTQSAGSEPSEPLTTVRSSVAAQVEVIRLGATFASGETAQPGVVYKPFFSHYQRALCSCYDKRSTDTKPEFQTCILEAERFK